LTLQLQRKVAIVLDGACDLDEAGAVREGIELVPVHMIFPDGTETDSNQFATRDFWSTLLEDYTRLPKTSQPTPFDFERKITELAQAGYEGVLILTISTGLAGTYDSASVAAQRALIPTRVVDTRSITYGQVALAREARRALNAGYTLDEAAAYTEAVRDDSKIYFVVNTMEYLVRGGRAGRAAGAIATALDIKPLLQVQDDGVIAAVKKCRGRKKAFAALAKIVTHDAKAARKGSQPYSYLMLQTDEPDVTRELHDCIRAVGFDGDYRGTQQVGIVVGIYCGPGTAAIIYWRAPDLADFRNSLKE
jgi:DegV family protein with EDD domain